MPEPISSSNACNLQSLEYAYNAAFYLAHVAFSGCSYSLWAIEGHPWSTTIVSVPTDPIISPCGPHSFDRQINWLIDHSEVLTKCTKLSAKVRDFQLKWSCHGRGWTNLCYYLGLPSSSPQCTQPLRLRQIWGVYYPSYVIYQGCGGL